MPSSSSYYLTVEIRRPKHYDIGFIEYFSPDQKWVPFATDHGVLTTKWSKSETPPLQVLIHPCFFCQEFDRIPVYKIVVYLSLMLADIAF